jgi:hypothetical protein
MYGCTSPLLPIVRHVILIGFSGRRLITDARGSSNRIGGAVGPFSLSLLSRLRSRSACSSPRAARSQLYSASAAVVPAEACFEACFAASIPRRSSAPQSSRWSARVKSKKISSCPLMVTTRPLRLYVESRSVDSTSFSGSTSLRPLVGSMLR